jgi:hypothetical protein
MMPRQKNQRAEKRRQINKDHENLAVSISESMDKAFVEVSSFYARCREIRLRYCSDDDNEGGLLSRIIELEKKIP